MNKQWIEHGYNTAEYCCRDLDYGRCNFDRFEYLDIIGLFETSWMIYEYHDNRNYAYGYPSNE